jgi:ribonuclease T2
MPRRPFNVLRSLAAIAFLSGLATLPASAQRNYDSGAEGKDRYLWNYKKEEVKPNTPGQFDYYAFVLSWSPTHCGSEAGSDDDQQCNRTDGRRYSFIVHGLWPQYNKGWPQNCVPRGTSYVPQKLIDDMMEIMPSKRLIIHEFRKHGTCSGLAPFAYFDMIRKQFDGFTIPKRYVNPFESQFVSPEDFIEEVLDVNPQLKQDMLAVSCGGPGNRLKELRICLSKDGQPTACGNNESQRKLCSAPKMFVPPVRSARATGSDGPLDSRPTTKPPVKGYPNSPLPAPR